MKTNNNNTPVIKTVEADGRQIRIAVRYGDENVTPILFCNGIGANLELLNPFIEQLDPKIGTISFDVPGVGGSPTPIFPYTLAGLTDVLATILNQLGFKKVVVLGVSWGGAVAQEFAHRHPEKCVKLILAATSAGMFMVPGNASVLLKMATPYRYLNPAYMLSIAPLIYGGEIAKKPELLQTHLDSIKMNSSIGYVWQLIAGLGWTSIHWLHLLKQPTLVLAGDEDPIVPPINAKILANQIPHSSLHIFKGGGHLFMIGFAKEVIPIMEEFVYKELPQSV